MTYYRVKGMICNVPDLFYKDYKTLKSARKFMQDCIKKYPIFKIYIIKITEEIIEENG